MLKTSGYPISLIFNEIEYKENKISLNIDDKILFYTDGITEVKNIHGEEFGIEKIIEIIEEDKENILNRIVGNVENFRWGEQMDDFAMILMEVLE